jgi:hypothetical protein
MSVIEMPPKASLAGLPAEIRRKTFSLVIQPEGTQKTDLENRWLTEHLAHLVAIHYSDSRPPKLNKPSEAAPGHQLLLVSRACYQEAAPLLYASQGFYLFNDYDWSMWWRVQPFLHPPSFELHHMKHPIPSGFAFVRELAFQPRPEISIDFVRAIHKNFPALHTLRAFRHIYLHDPDGRLTGAMPHVWTEFHRFVLLAALVVTRNHPTLKHAKWSDWRYFPHGNAEDSVRTMTVKLTPDDLLSSNEVCGILLEPLAHEMLNVTRKEYWIWKEYRICPYLMPMLGRRRSVKTSSALRTFLSAGKRTSTAKGLNKTSYGQEEYVRLIRCGTNIQFWQGIHPLLE